VLFYRALHEGFVTYMNVIVYYLTRVADCFENLQVLQKAMIHGGLKKGLHECAKALDRRSARLCCLAKDCENEEYKKLIKALCAEGEVHVVMVENGKELGAWCGLAKLDDDGGVKKAVRTSCAVVVDFGEETRALKVLLDFLQKQADAAEL
jgi:small subunit ribosomal protein S12e